MTIDDVDLIFVNDLTFQEVAEALSHLQGKTNNQADIIPGIISDPRMENRVQVILIITGLGATPLDSKPVARQAREKINTPAVMDTSLSVPSPVEKSPVHEMAQMELVAAPAGLDLPAFMRRRAR